MAESTRENAGERSTLAVALIVALWLGAAALFSGVVAPSAFSVLPSRAMSGALVGRILPVILVLGITAGVLVMVFELRAPRTRHWIYRTAGGLLIAVACAIAQLGIAPRIARIRDTVGAPIDSLTPDAVERLAFGRLHTMSVLWLAVAMLAAISVLVFAWMGTTGRERERTGEE